MQRDFCVWEDLVGPGFCALVVGTLVLLIAAAYAQEDSRIWALQHAQLQKRCHVMLQRGWWNFELVQQAEASNAVLIDAQKGPRLFVHPSVKDLTPIDCHGAQ